MVGADTMSRFDGRPGNASPVSGYTVAAFEAALTMGPRPWGPDHGAEAQHPALHLSSRQLAWDHINRLPPNTRIAVVWGMLIRVRIVEPLPPDWTSNGTP